MSRGRPPAGPRLVDGLEGSETAKERLRVVLQTIAGELSVIEACTRLNVSEARFHELRAEVLQMALQHLEPKPAGRPSQQSDPQAAEMATLKEQIEGLKIQLRATQIREELAILMPGVLKPREQSPEERRTRLDRLQDSKKKSPRHRKLDALQDAMSSTPKNSNKSGKPST
jgi:hypothetical protein